MLNFKIIKKLIIDKNTTLEEILKIDGRSRQYITRECKAGNQKVLREIYYILKKM